MSKMIFDESKPDWKKYAVHDNKNIKGFFGEYRWLSNFHLCEVWADGRGYISSENAYQAAKVDLSKRGKFENCSPMDSKKIWKKIGSIYTPEQWDSVKYDVMSAVCFDKFYRNQPLREKLLETGDRYLEETNHWEDIYWGADINRGGRNLLGEILMRIRSFWS